MTKPFTKRKISRIKSKAWIEGIFLYHTQIWYKKRNPSSMNELYEMVNSVKEAIK